MRDPRSFGQEPSDQGGFGVGLNKRAYEQAGVLTEGNVTGSWKEAAFAWMTGFLFVNSFIGLFIKVSSSQAVGTAMGCTIAPLTFLLFYKAFDIGKPNGEYKAPHALIFRNMAILGVQGFSALPQHCLQLCYGFFAFGVASNIVRDLSPKSIAKYTPLPIAMAVPFLVGAYFAINMCVGSLVVFVMTKINKTKAKSMVPAVASGLLCGDGMWLLPASILALAKISPPICMSILPSKSSSGY